MSVFRESTVIVIESNSRTIRAGVGLGDFLRGPSIEFPARVGLRKNLFSFIPASSNGITNGKSSYATNGHASKSPMDLELNGQPSNRNEKRLYTRPRRPAPVMPDAKVSDYLVGSQLDEAITAGEDLDIYWPFEYGDQIHSWPQVEALWKYVLFTRLQLRRKQNESPVALCIPSCLSRTTHELITQLFFERFNVAGFMLMERPLMQLFGANAINGVVIDVSHSDTTITPIAESVVLNRHALRLDVGTRDCELYLATLLRANQQVVAALSEGDTLTDEQLFAELTELSKQVWREGLVKVPSDGETAQTEEDEGITNIAALLVAGKEKAAIEAGTKKKATAKQTQAEREREREIAALDLVQVQFKDKTLTLGRERHRFCEPLFDPTLLESLPATTKDPLLDLTVPLQEGVHFAVNSLPIDRRWHVWGGVFISGDIANCVKGLGPALQSRLHPYLLTDQEGNKYVKFVKVPEYFSDYRDRWDVLAAFLGTSIVAKLCLTDPSSKSYLTKADYANHGPRAILDFSPAVY